MSRRKKDEKPALPVPEPGEEKRRRLLEEVLSHMLPAAQAEQAVQSLYNAFGSFLAIFMAPSQEIARVPGIGGEVARFLELTMEVARTCMEDQAAGLTRIYDLNSIVEAFRPKFVGRKTEAVCLMLLDGRGRLIYNQILSEGSFTEVPVYLRRLCQLCIEYNARNVLLAHNHPSGVALPSRNDAVVTFEVELMLESIDATLSDHIIFAGEDIYSFAKSGLLGKDRERILECRREILDIARRMEEGGYENAADQKEGG